MKIVGIGETVFDIVFKDGKPQAAVPGGSVFNAIISLGRTAGAAAASTAPRVIMATQMGKDNVQVALLRVALQRVALQQGALRQE